MRGISILLMASTGFVIGCMSGVVFEGGFENPAFLLDLGLLGAIALAILQLSFIFSSNVEYNHRRSRASRRPLKRRQEIESSFNERMERFAANVQQETKADVESPKMPLWIAEDLKDFEPSPPKPIGIIRMLLQRIRKVLTGN